MENIEQAREFWAKVAKENGWHSEPFFVQIWLDKEGKISDSVSSRILTADVVIPWEKPDWCDSCGADLTDADDVCEVCGDEF